MEGVKRATDVYTSYCRIYAYVHFTWHKYEHAQTTTSVMDLKNSKKQNESTPRHTRTIVRTWKGILFYCLRTHQETRAQLLVASDRKDATHSVTGLCLPTEHPTGLPAKVVARTSTATCRSCDKYNRNWL